MFCKIICEIVCAFSPMYQKVSLAHPGADPVKTHKSIALDRRCFTVPFAIPAAHALSVWIGVAVCGCPISRRVLRSMAASFPLKNRAPISASVAEDRTLDMMEEWT